MGKRRKQLEIIKIAATYQDECYDLAINGSSTNIKPIPRLRLASNYKPKHCYRR